MGLHSMIINSEKLNLWLIAVDFSFRLNLILKIKRVWKYERWFFCKLQKVIKILIVFIRRSHFSFTNKVAKINKHFYRQSSTKVGLIDKKQLTTFNTDVSTNDKKKKTAAMFKSRIESNANLQKHDVIEIHDMTASFEKIFFNVFHESASNFKNIETTTEDKIH